VLVASARVDQAKAQTGQARAFLLPSLLLNAKTGRENSAPGAELDPTTGRVENRSNHSRTDTSLTLRQPLLDLPSLFDWKRREVLEKSREEGMRTSQGDAYLATVNAYLGLVSSRVQADMTLDYENQLQELFQYIDKRAKAGAATNSDKERVRARSLNARAARIEQDAAQAAAGVEFVRLVNIAPATLRLPDMEDVGISIVPSDLQKAMPLAIESNPDIAVLREELRAAQIDQTAVKGRLFPRLDLELSDNNSVHAGGASGSQHDQRMMVVMNWSIFNGGSDIKLGNEKAARTSEISYRLDDQRRRVLQSLTAQYATLEATRQRITAGYRELESISTAARAMSNRMVSGNQSLLDMLDVYDRFYQARTRLVALHVQEMGAVAQIARLVQGAPSAEGVASLQPSASSDLVN
jgi:adhesin transport system outer membrane protein